MRKVFMLCCLLICGKTFSQNWYPPTGNVGIGTGDNPQADLHIAKNGQAQIILGGNDPYIFSGITFVDRGQSTAGKVGTWAIYAGRDGGTWGSGLGFHRYDAVNACSTGICDVPLFIHASGNVGLGTSTPAERLDVRGGVYAEKLRLGNAPSNTNSRASFNSYASGLGTQTNQGWVAADFGGNDNVSDRVVIGTGFNGKSIIATNNFNLSDWGGALLLNPIKGNVGIGTTNPTEKLAVNGNIRSRKIIVTQSDWSDYVFDSSYVLPSLDSVASFIQENKHLPDMPSTVTVIKDGQDVGEIQKLLLKKIEELTLYVIELKKENTELQKRVEKIEVRK